jgi:hypothetical protein
MIGSSYDPNHRRTREILIQVTFHNPMEMVSIESNGQLGAALAAAPLLFSQAVDPYCVFCISPPPHPGIIRGVHYIVVKLRHFGRGEVCSIWTHEASDGPHPMARKLDYAVGPILALVEFPIDFFLSWSSMSRKNYVAKILDPFDVLKAPISQKHAKTSKSTSHC